jgi:hypothetical protein
MPYKEALIDHSNNTQCAAIYARVSTEDQGKGFPIPTQLEAGRELAGREEYTGRRL